MHITFWVSHFLVPDKILHSPPSTKPSTVRRRSSGTRLLLERLEDRLAPATFTVQNVLDDGSQYSLRWAVNQANSSPGDNIITFSQEVFASPQMVNLIGGQLTLSNTTGQTIIQGPGADLLSVNGNNASRVFSINSGVMATITGLTITGGKAFGGEWVGAGGGIYSAGNLILANCTVSNNSAYGATRGWGGGIANYFGTMIVSNCTVSSNSVYASTYTHGPGIENYYGTLTVSGSNIINNQTHSWFGYGGGIENYQGTAVVTGSTISGNFGGGPSSWTWALPRGGPGASGGGIYSFGSLSVIDSTISDNTNKYGGGIYFSALEGSVMTVVNTTITGNWAKFGGGIYCQSNPDFYGSIRITSSSVCDNSALAGGGIGAGMPLTLQSSIVANNSLLLYDPNYTVPEDEGDIFGTVDSQSAYNLVGDGIGLTGISNGDGNHNQVGTTASPIDPLLAPLGNNGGPTQTRALLAGSPAIGSGDPNALDANGNPLTTDQRGFNRSTTPDMGAYETMKVALGGPTSGIPSQPLDFTGTLTGADSNTVQYTWQVNGQTVGTSRQMTWTPQDVGTDNVSITAQQPGGASASASATVAVNRTAWEGNDLVIGSTTDNAEIVLDPGTNQPDTLKVTFNGIVAADDVPQAETIIVRGGAGDHLTVNASWSNGLVLDAEAGSDTYTVNFGSLSGTVTVEDGGTAGSDNLIVNGAKENQTLYKGMGCVRWRPEGAPDYLEEIDFSGMEQLDLYGGPGNDIIVDPGSNTRIFGLGGDDTISIDATTGNGVAIDGGPGTNNYLIDFGNLAGPVTIDNSSSDAQNHLVVNGGEGDNTILFSGDQLIEGTQAILLGNPLESVAINGGSGTTQVTVTALVVPIDNLAITGGAGQTEITVTDLGMAMESLSLAGGAGATLITVADLGVSVDSLSITAGLAGTTVSLIDVGSSVGSLEISGGQGLGETQIQVEGDLPPNTTVINLMPEASIAGPAVGVPGQPRSFTATESNPDVFRYTLCWGDGSSSPMGTAPLEHVYSETGFYEVTVMAIDPQGRVYGPLASAPVTVIRAGLQGTDLVVGGTTGNDTLVFSQGPGEAISVRLNGQSLGSFSPTGRLVAYGQAGDDDLQVAGSISLSAWLYGGDGNDRLKGGDGNDLLLGGDGGDLLLGGGGRDLLIGGRGADRILGNGDDDILIAGLTKWDGNQTALGAILAEWNSTNKTFQERVDQLMAGCGPDHAFALNTATVGDDTDEDVLTGSSGQDWFLFNRDKDGVVKDKATDLSTFEAIYVLDLDFINGR